MDNARYQLCNKVTEQAKALGIAILFLPPCSPNLNLIERLWKFTKKYCMRCFKAESFSGAMIGKSLFYFCLRFLSIATSH
jgi:transposase